MNYKKHYTLLIDRARIRILPVNVYSENHHIIPRCVGGTNCKTNLVKLTAEEHFLAHQLLVKIYPSDPKLVYAAHLMCFDPAGNRSNNKSFGWIRRRVGQLTGERFKIVNKKPHSIISCPHCNKEGGRNALSRYHFDNCKNHPDPDIANKNKLARKTGHKQSEATKLKRKETQKFNPPNLGKKHSDETKKLMSEIKLRSDNPVRGKKAGPQKRVICPHCDKEGGLNNMIKYHFDNCKKVPNEQQK